MAVKMSDTQIKLEQSSQEVSGETITDIQNYLNTFNKEIGGDNVVQQVGDEIPGDQGPDESATYFVDQAGHYYYQTGTADGQQVMTVVSGIANPNSDVGDANETSFVMQVEGVSENMSGEGGGDDVVDESGQMILSGADGFQTVRIMPTETNPGEVSYVLIVQQPDDDKDKDDQEDPDYTVYDFNEQEDNEPVSGMESGDEDDKSKIIKLLPKKSQTVTQAHMCNYCNYTSPKRYLLSRHMKSHSEERPHKCSVCERGFKTLASLQNHVNTHTGTKPHRCKYCDSAFTTSGELVRHVRYKHTHEKPHKCTICEYASVELSKMRNHMRCHTGERPYQCPHCTYASPDTFKLKRHLRIHTGEKPYECDICHARFTQSNSLKAHKLIHSAGDKPVFHCELCPATCGRKTDLRIHVQKLHTSDKPLRCKRCGKQFPDRYTFKVHNKSHEGEKCWRCELCPYASVSQRHLESHMLIHTDQKPYQCDKCDQSFRQKQLLKRHQNLYHNPNYIPPAPREKTHECPECQRAFRHKGNLIRHMSVHDPESSIHEKAVALKMGRQKKIQIIDGQQVEVMPGLEDEEDEEDEMDGSMVAVEGSDGQQYVVLEVIQLQDGDGQEQAVAVMAGEGIEQAVAALQQQTGQNTSVLMHSNQVLTQHITPDHASDNEDVMLTTNQPKIVPQQNDMQNCFGFDEDDEEEQDEKNKPDIHILQSAIH